jgi:hypothetical protein
MSLSKMSYNNLHGIITEKTRERDEIMINRIVHEIYNMVIQSAEKRLLFVKWTRVDHMFDDVMLYEHKHIVIATTRLKVLFPETTIRHNKMREITVDWH